MDEIPWLVDEMLGRLARYIRFLGYDAEYVRGASDDQVARKAGSEHRRLLTRDRALASRVPGSILLTRTDIEGQLKELQAAYPDLRTELRFDRCSVCNGRLERAEPTSRPVAAGLTPPPEVREGISPLYECTACGHPYWEGSHTRSVRKRLSQWVPGPPSA